MSRPRLLALDAVRGIALFGILVVNLPALTLPLAMSGLPDPTDAWDLLAWIPVKWLFETKFLVVFSLLFGMGAALQSEGAARRGVAFAPGWRRRMGVLAGIGLLHATLLWSGDILLHYALVGLCLPPLLRLRGRLVLPVIAALIGLPWLVGVVGHAVLAVLPETAPPALHLADAPAWLQSMAAAGFEPRAPGFQASEVWVWTTGALQDQLLLRLGTWAGFQGVLLATLQPLRTLGVFLLGIHLWRSGLFRADGTALRRGLTRWGLGAGLVVEGLVVLLHLGAGLVETHPLAVLAEAVHALSGLAVGLGLAGALAHLGLRPGTEALLRPIARAGRMALTSYLGHSVAGLVLVGLVGFGVLHRAWHLPVALLVVAAQIGLALWWLDRFQMGPVEWAWRALTKGRLPELVGPAR